MTTTYDHAVLDLPLNGRNIDDSDTLRDVLNDGPTLLVFLRHFGCIFCRETVKDLKRVVANDPAYPQVIFFHQGTPDEGDHHFSRLWPEARAVSDIPKTYYDAFDIKRGGLREMFGPVVWACGVRSTLKGNRIGMKTGDPWTMPTLILMDGDRIVWDFVGKHAGDHPDFAAIPQAQPAQPGA